MSDEPEVPSAPIDKAKWGPGPWQDEPDRVEWEYQGYPCLMVRNPVLGNWCGYAAVPPGHPWHGKSANDLDVHAHGGVTFSSLCDGHICHVPKPGEPADVWWLGFDAGHAWDIVPGLESLFTRAGRSEEDRELMSTLSEACNRRYRTVDYIRAQVEGLADQARMVAADVVDLRSRR